MYINKHDFYQSVDKVITTATTRNIDQIYIGKMQMN